MLLPIAVVAVCSIISQKAPAKARKKRSPVRRQKRRHDETPRASTNPGPAAQHRGWQHEIGCDREHEDTAGLPDPVRLIERHGLEVDSRLEQHVTHERIEEDAGARAHGECLPQRPERRVPPHRRVERHGREEEHEGRRLVFREAIERSHEQERHDELRRSPGGEELDANQLRPSRPGSQPREGDERRHDHQHG